LLDLAEYLKIEGPFDGVIGFSGGAALAASLLIRDAGLQPPFKVAILFSCVPILDPKLLMDGIAEPVGLNHTPLIHIPTVHIWGTHDVVWKDSAEVAVQLCSPEGRNVFVHDGGHAIPGGKDKMTTVGVVHAIRRTIAASFPA
jgi:predicted esterase